ELLAGWVAAGTESARAEFGDRHTVYTVEEVRERQRQVTDRRIELLAAVRGGEVVAEGALHLPQLDNRHFAALFLSVRPGWRRRGIGSALLAELERRAVAADRTTLCVESDVAVGRPAAAEHFALRHGYAR